MPTTRCSAAVHKKLPPAHIYAMRHCSEGAPRPTAPYSDAVYRRIPTAHCTLLC